MHRHRFLSLPAALAAPKECRIVLVDAPAALFQFSGKPKGRAA
jgi:hypothetical protein